MISSGATQFSWQTWHAAVGHADYWTRLVADWKFMGEGETVQRPCRVAVVDDHVLVRDGLIRAMSGRPDLVVVAVANVPAAVFEVEPAPDLVLLDVELNGTATSPEDVAAMIARGSRVLIVSALASPRLVRDMIRAGAAGFVPKRDSADTLLKAIDEVLADRFWTSPALAAILSSDRSVDRPELSEQERRALMLYASGLKLASVARRMDISIHTAKQYIDRVRDKYVAAGRSVGTKTDLFRAAVSDGHIDL